MIGTTQIEVLRFFVMILYSGSSLTGMVSPHTVPDAPPSVVIPRPKIIQTFVGIGIEIFSWKIRERKLEFWPRRLGWASGAVVVIKMVTKMGSKSPVNPPGRKPRRIWMKKKPGWK